MLLALFFVVEFKVSRPIIAITAFALLTVAAVGFAVVPYSWTAYLACYLVGGIGSGFLYTALPNLIVEAVPAEQQGISAGMLGVVQSMGSGIVIAITTALLNNNPVEAHIDVAGHASTQVIPQVFTDRGYTQSFWLVTGTTIVALAIAVLMRHGRKPATGGV
ncbi:hypothetical protein [Nocardia pseudovaccinii]|uniref:hypothetical protein n=1 Tax=Nocardia pseudovaccinii TaxID=189540 RepID=UPI0007A3EC31|nr:hypothetical protein [Nocardia pseudovaccinii]